jgi:hypothetical protein
LITFDSDLRDSRARVMISTSPSPAIDDNAARQLLPAHAVNGISASPSPLNP